MIPVRAPAFMAALSLGTVSLALPTSASADPHFRTVPVYGTFYGKTHWKGGSHYAPRPGRRHHRGLGRTGSALLGLGVGVVLGSALSRSAARSRPVYAAPYAAPHAAPPVVYAAPPVAYAAPATYAAPRAYPTPVVRARPLPPQAPASAVPASCGYSREYQTTIVVGGVERPAYGTACMMPDGSWQMGPAVAEPY